MQVRLPGRPSGHTGWIVADRTRRTSTGWHLAVALSARRVTVYRDGRAVRRFRAVVGAAVTPTPRGRFFVEEAVALTAADAGGPFALATSARSDVLQEFNGGPGQIAIHGTGNLFDPLGSAASHGCVRLGTARHHLDRATHRQRRPAHRHALAGAQPCSGAPRAPACGGAAARGTDRRRPERDHGRCRQRDQRPPRGDAELAVDAAGVRAHRLDRRSAGRGRSARSSDRCGAAGAPRPRAGSAASRRRPRGARRVRRAASAGARATRGGWRCARRAPASSFERHALAPNASSWAASALDQSAARRTRRVSGCSRLSSRTWAGSRSAPGVEDQHVRADARGAPPGCGRRRCPARRRSRWRRRRAGLGDRARADPRIGRWRR